MGTPKIGIRELVEFVLRAGNLNASMNSQNTAAEGARIHRMLQKQRASNYEKEYTLEKTIEMADRTFIVHGRADGVIRDTDHPLIEEIKTSDALFEDLSENTLTLYWAQAKVYAAILMEQESLTEITIQLTYYQRLTEKITQTEQQITLADAQAFLKSLTDEYAEWLRFREELHQQRNDSIQTLPFPFDQYRQGQRELAAVVYKTIAFHKHLWVEAPTGTGKTISTLFPSIKAMGEDKFNRLFYLTAKQSTRQVAEEAISLLKHKGLRIKSITLTAKDKITFPDEVGLQPEDNPYMIGYYDRLKPAIKDMVANEDLMTRQTIEAYAKKHRLDPFEFSLDASLFCDVIVCDYNYLFDPQVYLQRFFAIDHDDDNFFLIDEAHNLVNRSRDMYSAEVSSAPLLKLINQFKDDDELSEAPLRHLRALNRAFRKYSKPLRDSGDSSTIFPEEITSLNKAIRKLTDYLHDWMITQPKSDLLDETLDYYFSCSSYLKIADYYDETYRTKIALNERDDHLISFKQICLDPSAFLKESLDKGCGAVLFSATLSPLDYYQRVLGGDDDSLRYQLTSPFPPENQEILITQYIQTTYQHRQSSMANILTSIHTLVTGKTGNYLIFLPSYKFLETVSEAFQSQYPDIDVVVQTGQMAEPQREAFVRHFQPNPAKTLVGFAILGGIFSEGIDLRADRLIGVGIVSVGLPGISDENNLLRDYFDEQNQHGFAFAYQIPGLNNVFQAAGRLVRGSHDTGIVLLMDQRFGANRYTNLFPPHWQNYQRVFNPDQLTQRVKQFWQNK